MDKLFLELFTTHSIAWVLCMILMQINVIWGVEMAVNPYYEMHQIQLDVYLNN